MCREKIGSNNHVVDVYRVDLLLDSFSSLHAAAVGRVNHPRREKKKYLDSRDAVQDV